MEGSLSKVQISTLRFTNLKDENFYDCIGDIKASNAMTLGADVVISDCGNHTFKERVTCLDYSEETSSYWLSTVDLTTKVAKVRELSDSALVFDRES